MQFATEESAAAAAAADAAAAAPTLPSFNAVQSRRQSAFSGEAPTSTMESLLISLPRTAASAGGVEILLENSRQFDDDDGDYDGSDETRELVPNIDTTAAASRPSRVRAQTAQPRTEQSRAKSSASMKAPAPRPVAASVASTLSVPRPVDDGVLRVVKSGTMRKPNFKRKLQLDRSGCVKHIPKAYRPRWFELLSDLRLVYHKGFTPAAGADRTVPSTHRAAGTIDITAVQRIEPSRVPDSPEWALDLIVVEKGALKAYTICPDGQAAMRQWTGALLKLQMAHAAVGGP
jgi:hypothetical protein